jgi:hypothetical protein
MRRSRGEPLPVNRIMEQANRERFPISPVETSSNACPRASPRRLEYLLTRPNRREREGAAPDPWVTSRGSAISPSGHQSRRMPDRPVRRHRA